MAKIYYDLIKGGHWQIEKVPTRWREQVQAMLDADENKGDDESNE